MKYAGRRCTSPGTAGESRSSLVIATSRGQRRRLSARVGSSEHRGLRNLLMRTGAANGARTSPCACLLSTSTRLPEGASLQRRPTPRSFMLRRQVLGRR